MSRESRREKDRLERAHERDGGKGASSSDGDTTSSSRTSPAQYVREVRRELSMVHWPNRAQLTQYSIAVLIFVAILMTYVFLVDQAFGQLVLWVFG